MADDAEFFRRLSLDLTGRIPSITALKDFIDDNRPDKKRIWTELLMADRQFQDNDQQQLFNNHFTAFWQSTIFSQANMQARFAGFQMNGWVQNHVKNNTPFDKVVYDLLTTQQNYYQDQREQGGDDCQQHLAAVPRHPPRMRPVPRRSLRR